MKQTHTQVIKIVPVIFEMKTKYEDFVDNKHRWNCCWKLIVTTEHASMKCYQEYDRNSREIVSLLVLV